MEQDQKHNILIQQEEKEEQPESVEVNVPEIFTTEKKTISTRLGSLIILLAATIAGAGVWWYSFSYEEPQMVDVNQLSLQLQERKEIEKEVFSNYEIKADRVYFHGKLIEEADVETFVILMDLFYIDNSSGYSKDKSKVFFKENEILGVDVESFVLMQQYDGKVIETGMAQDINNRYYFGRRIVERDIVDELENLGDSYYKDEFNVYREMRYSSGSHSIFIPVILSQFDVESFEFIGLCWYMEGSGSYHESYIKDKNNVFCGEDKLEKADPHTFEVIGFLEEGEQDAGVYFFSKDKNYVYQAEVLLENKNPETFEILEVFESIENNL